MQTTKIPLAARLATAALLLGGASSVGAAAQARRAVPALATAQPLPPTTQMRQPLPASPISVKRPVVGGLSEATKARLKAAGLDAKDPGLATKLQAKLRSSAVSFLGAHISSIRIAPKRPQLSSTRSMGGGAPSSATSSVSAVGGDRISSGLLPGVATFVALYQTMGNQNSAIQGVKAINGDWKYMALFSSPKALTGAAPFSATVTFSGPCNVNSVVKTQLNTSSIGEMFGCPAPPGDGKHYYYLNLPNVGFDFGASPGNLMISMDGPMGLGSFSMPASSHTVTATITLTVDSAPPFVTSNNFGIGKGNGIFANPSATRLDPGTSATTSGDDTVGLGVNLGPGWTVTSAKVIAANSVLDAPNDSAPDNAYRGASVTQMPSSGRLQTSVHWHYGMAESLNYTIEWQLQGPGGQRPILTMPLGGPCDK